MEVQSFLHFDFGFR